MTGNVTRKFQLPPEPHHHCTRSSAVTERPCAALCHSIFC